MRTIIILIIFSICSSFIFTPSREIDYKNISELLDSTAKAFTDKKTCSDDLKAIYLLQTREIICESMIKNKAVASEKPAIDYLQKNYKQCTTPTTSNSESLWFTCPACPPSSSQVITVGGGVHMRREPIDKLLFAILTPEQKRTINNLMVDQDSKNTWLDYLDVNNKDNDIKSIQENLKSSINSSSIQKVDELAPSNSAKGITIDGKQYTPAQIKQALDKAKSDKPVYN